MKEIVNNLPESPGVYKMISDAGAVIYVGKAKNVRQRVKSYFHKDYAHSTRTRKLMEAVKNIEVLATDTELEALILENNLIKELRPRYNILMKDDKSYVYIKVDLSEDFPRIRVVRGKDLPLERRDPRARADRGVRFFGPKLASSKVYETLRILKKLFPFRHCQLDIKCRPGAKGKHMVEVSNRVIDFPCLDYFIKRCGGPCIGAIRPEEYKKIVRQIVDFLEGKNDDLEKKLTQEMKEAAEKKLFEKAACIRDKLFAIQSITEKQKISDPDRIDTDIINFWADMGRIYFTLLMIRKGKLINQENFALDALEIDEKAAIIECADILDAFITQYYEKAGEIPSEILISEALESKDSIETWLTKKRGASVHITIPQRGTKNHLCELALKNAISFGKQYRLKWLAKERMCEALGHLADVLNMKDKKLTRIEGFDISHLGGDEIVGSMVVFENGVAKSSDYRHFKLRTIANKPDDYRSMEEVLMRRLKYLKKYSNIRIKKASKKDMNLLIKCGTEEGWKELENSTDVENFYILIYEKKKIGMVRCMELQNGIFELSALYIMPQYRGEKLSYTLLEKVISRIKNQRARFYLNVEEDLINHYAEYGFIMVHDMPEIVKTRNKYWSHIDQKKYTVMGYYKAKKKKDDHSLTARPDLVMIDGGKGQLSTAVSVLKRLKINIPVIALAKRLEEIYLPGEKAPLLLEEGDEALKLLQRIRDESHRFAITFQRKLHRKSILEK